MNKAITYKHALIFIGIIILLIAGNGFFTYSNYTGLEKTNEQLENRNKEIEKDIEKENKVITIEKKKRIVSKKKQQEAEKIYNERKLDHEKNNDSIPDNERDDFIRSIINEVHKTKVHR